MAVRRVVVLGRGGAGKSTLAARLGAATGIPVVELDAVYWRPDLTPIPRDEWAALQRRLAAAPTWILDGDLGPSDAPQVRLAAADTVLVLDLPLRVCAWRAVRRGREDRRFWSWVWSYRRRHLPRLRAMISVWAPGADVHVLRSSGAVERFLRSV